jgi:uncharacterized protein YfaS (alpha-2-macroglobulin family)
VSFLPVENIKELQEPGIYVAIMNQPGRFGWDYQVTHYYVTDIGLHLRRHAAQIDVFATSLKSGGALKGIELSLVDEAGKAVGQARPTATAMPSSPASSTRRAPCWPAAATGDVDPEPARRGAGPLEFDATGHPSRSNKLFVYAGRDLYRPGESFPAVGAGARCRRQALPEAAAGHLTVKKPDGSKLVEQLVQPARPAATTSRPSRCRPTRPPAAGRQARIDPAPSSRTRWAFKVEEFLPERMIALTAAEGAPARAA